jgi:hypothetical protein
MAKPKSKKKARKVIIALFGRKRNILYIFIVSLFY